MIGSEMTMLKKEMGKFSKEEKGQGGKARGTHPSSEIVPGTGIHDSFQKSWVVEKYQRFAARNKGQKPILYLRTQAEWSRLTRNNFPMVGPYMAIPHPGLRHMPRRDPAELLHIPLKLESEETFNFLGFTEKRSHLLWDEYKREHLLGSKPGDLLRFAQSHLRTWTQRANFFNYPDDWMKYWNEQVELRLKNNSIYPPLLFIDPPFDPEGVAPNDWWYDLLGNRYNFLFDLDDIMRGLISGRRDRDWTSAKINPRFGIPKDQRVYPEYVRPAPIGNRALDRSVGGFLPSPDLINQLWEDF